MDDEIDPALIAILAQLWRAAQGTPERAWSMAKLSKQSAVPMSSLRRQVTALSDAGWSGLRFPMRGRRRPRLVNLDGRFVRSCSWEGTSRIEGSGEG